MILRNALLALTALALAPATAWACPAYDIAVSQVSGTSYNPTDSIDTPLIVQLTATSAPLPAACETLPVRIEGAPGDPQPLRFAGGGGRLAADFIPSPEASFAFASLTLSADARARLIRGQTVTVQVARVQAGQFLRSGPYRSQLRVIAGTTEVNEALTVTVEPAMLLQLSSADGVEDILLNGDPQTGTSGSTVLFYRTNTSLRVSATSLNGGVLVHQNGAATGRIPYNATLDGFALDFAGGPAVVDFGFAQTNLQSRTLAVQVPPAGPLAAGRYEDVITFSFAPY